jgi:hypothetical protein
VTIFALVTIFYWSGTLEKPIEGSVVNDDGTWGA